MNASEMHATTNCPSEETLAAFVDGRLDRKTRADVVEHMAGCADCRDIERIAREYHSDAAAATVLPAIPSRRWRLMPIAAALAASVVIVVSVMVLRPRHDMQEVVEASAPIPYRPSMARLSADFPYKERKPVLRRVEDEQPFDARYAKLQGLVGEIHQDVERNPTPSRRHALGVSYLLTGHAKEAVEQLEAAVKQETAESDTIRAIARSSNAALLNDLAAAYVTLIERRGALELRPSAVEAVQRAWSLQKTPQIAWTRAVVIESLHIRESAIQAWREYLELDPSSEWSAEAKHRLSNLEQPTDAELWPAVREQLARSRDGDDIYASVDRFRQQVRTWCEDELLPAWGRAVLEGDPSAGDRLRKIAALAGALERVNGARDVLEAVEAIRRADAAAVRQLARGHAAYGAGRTAIVSPAGETAVREMDIAVAALTPALTPFAWRARAEHAAAAYTSNRYRQALDELAMLSSQVDDPSAVLTGRIHWVSGIAALRSRSPREAVEHYLLALEAFRSLGETDSQAAIHTRLFAAYRELGRHEDAGQHNEEALRLLAQSGNTRRRHEVIFEAAYTAVRSDQPALAGLLLDAVVEHDVRSGQAVTACTSLMWRGTYGLRQGAIDRGRMDLQKARAFCGSIQDPGERQRLLANLGLALSMVPDSAPEHLPELDSSIEYFNRTDSRDWLRTAYLVRARMLSGRGDAVGAERDFRSAVDAMMETRSAIHEQDSRLAFTASYDETADAYIEFLLAQQRDREAFEVADGSRARELVDSPSARWRTSVPSTLRTVQSALPPNAAVVEYRVMSGRIVAWVVGARTFAVETLPVSYPDVGRILARLDPALPEVQFRDLTASLHDALIAPLHGHLKPFRTLILIPDDDLERVPYAALFDRTTNQYLAQTWTTITGYSADLVVQSAQRYAERTKAEDEVVVVQASSAGGNADVLPGAAREARFIAALFPHARVIAAAGSRPADVLGSASDATLLHFAGHGGREAFGRHGALRLDDGALLSPSDVMAASLSRIRIAYLSACDTEAGPILKAEGSATIARAFFAAGVPVVVATLWPVEDSVARAVARVFYERLRAGAPPADALRDAQLSALSHSTGSRADWAAFRVIGAGIPFEKRSS